MHPALASALAALAPVGLAFARAGINVLISLASETFIKRTLVHALERLAKKTKATWDDQAASDLRKSWNIED